MKFIKYVIKYTPIIYTIYFYCLSILVRTLGLFVKTDPKMILFNSFGGRKYDDSPRAIFEKMLQDRRFDDYTFIWALENPEKFDIPKRAKVVKDYTYKFFVYALKAKVWITNSSMEHGLCFKKKNTIYINTWHGSAIKHLGTDIKKEGSFKGKGTTKKTAFYAQSEFDEYVFSRAFNLEKSILKRFGLPRNDELANYSEDKVNKIKETLNIPKDKKVILYTPTYREYSKTATNQIVQEMRIDLDRWHRQLSEKFVLLVRVHYEVAKTLDFTAHDSVINVSDYPHLNDLMIVSDALISDYSSIYFDYSILHKPMLCFAYDIEEYTKNRGMYIDIQKELPCTVSLTNDELFDEITYAFENYEQMCERTAKFQEKYVSEYGHASEKTCDFLIDVLNS